MKLYFLFAIYGSFIFLVICQIFNNFDNHFSEKTLKNLRVKENSFLRKIFHFKENNNKHFLYIRIIPIFIYMILGIIGTLIVVIDAFHPFITNSVYINVSIIVLVSSFLIEAIIGILSQGLHI